MELLLQVQVSRSVEKVLDVRQRSRVLTVVSALALLAVACGGSSKSTQATSAGGDIGGTTTRMVELHATAIAGSSATPIQATVKVTTRIVGSPSNLPTSTPGPPPTPSTFGLGFVHRWNPLFYQAAVYAIDTSAPPLDGKPVIAVDAEECMQAGAPADRTQVAQPNDFHLALADGTDIAPANGSHDNAFALTQLKAGQCVRGWISYTLPAGGVAERVVFTGKLNTGKAIAHVHGFWSTTQTQ